MGFNFKIIILFVGVIIFALFFVPSSSDRRRDKAREELRQNTTVLSPSIVELFRKANGHPPEEAEKADLTIFQIWDPEHAVGGSHVIEQFNSAPVAHYGNKMTFSTQVLIAPGPKIQKFELAGVLYYATPKYRRVELIERGILFNSSIKDLQKRLAKLPKESIEAGRKLLEENRAVAKQINIFEPMYLGNNGVLVRAKAIPTTPPVSTISSVEIYRLQQLYSEADFPKYTTK